MLLHILFVNVISTAVMLFSSLDCNQRNKNLFQCKPVTTDLILMFYMSGVAKQRDEITWRQTDV